ncbi:4-hydroxyphenylacetate isomerase [Geobacillus thermoleovorans]|uniref:fumarylacetoacetate hydrolase family protein n=1 Tax=Geobacillus TaxID=129337 RepID=UPI0007642127|nr:MULTISPECIES: fumarylacetoacetate hydrolase family protein [Geobacillus]ODA17949.1 4-hydroxyphenylacetate isomerase [Geobacillus thermoleovorans]
MVNVRLRLAGMGRAIEAKADPWSGTVSFGDRTHRIDEWEWAAPVDGAMYGVALNDEKEWEALSTEMNAPPYEKPPEGPVLYMKPANTINAHRRPVLLPRGVKHLQAAPALGIVIGRTAARVPCEQALDVVFGYTIVHDLSIPHKQRYRPAVKEQARDGFAPVGPWIVSHDEVGDPMALRLRTYVNGAVVQEGYTGDMIFSIPYLLEYITEFMTLAPGDVMLTGTPKGAVNVQPGDEVVTEIERIGRLVNYIA